MAIRGGAWFTPTAEGAEGWVVLGFVGTAKGSTGDANRADIIAGSLNGWFCAYG